MSGMISGNCCLTIPISINYLQKRAGEEFNFRNAANQILADFFAVLIFCYFFIKKKVKAPL